MLRFVAIMKKLPSLHRCDLQLVAITFISSKTIFPHATFSTTIYLAPRELSYSRWKTYRASCRTYLEVPHDQMNIPSRTNLGC
jgi:hypothetical protein